VQTFDPHKHFGASAARFFNYVNLCLGNKFRTIHSKRMKNPLCRPGNLFLTSHWEETDRDQVGDEFCHAHSAYLRGRCQRQVRQRDASHTLAEFAEFLRREDEVFSLSSKQLLRPRRPPLPLSCWGRRQRTSARPLAAAPVGQVLSGEMSQYRGNGDRIGDE
jgi:hypothetical protein